MSTDFDALSEATYEGVLFPISDAPCDGGNDFAEHTAYRRPGADMEPTGWRAWSGSFTVPCVNTSGLTSRYGKMWPEKLSELLGLFKDKPRGALSHPLLGNLTVAITDVSQSGGSDVRNGVTLTLKWKEHNGSLALLVGSDGAVTNDPTTTLGTKAADADEAGAGLTGYVDVADTIDEQATLLESAPRAYSEVLGAFRIMDAAVSANLSLASVQAIDGYDANLALLALRSAVQSYRARFLPNDAGLRYYVAPTTMSAAQVAIVAYGDVSQVSLVYAANTLLDPLVIAAGTVLTILPAS